MSKKISPRVREQAAIYCSAIASWLNSTGSSDDPGLDAQWPVDIVALDDSARLGLDERHGYGAEAWAEAEALLRTGWEP